MKKDSDWYNLKVRKEVSWLSEPLKGKMKGIQQAAKLFEMSFKFPEYDRLAILELLDKLKESDEEIIKNAAWMLLKLVNLKPDLLFKNINVIKTPIKIKNKKIRIFLGSIIKELALIDSSRVQTAIPQVVELLDDPNDDVKLIASQIFLILSKSLREKIEVTKQIALLNEKNSQIRLNAVETLINISELEKLTPILYEKLFILILYPQVKARVFNLIFQLIDKDAEQSLLFIKNQLKSQLVMIRRNALIFITQFLDKKFELLRIAIQELVYLLAEEFDKTNLQMILSTLKELTEFYPQSFNDQHFNKIIDLKDKFKKKFREDWIEIILNLSKNYEELQFEVQNLTGFLQKKIKKGSYDNRINIATLLNQILMWDDEYGPAIKIWLKILKDFPFEDNGEPYFWIGFNYHVIGDFKNALSHFSKGTRSKNEYICNKNILFSMYEYLLNFDLKNAKKFFSENEKRWETNFKKLTSVKQNILSYFQEYLNSIINLDFMNVKKKLEQYLSSCYHNFKWDKRYIEVELKNLEGIIERYKKTET